MSEVIDVEVKVVGRSAEKRRERWWSCWCFDGEWVCVKKRGGGRWRSSSRSKRLCLIAFCPLYVTLHQFIQRRTCVHFSVMFRPPLTQSLNHFSLDFTLSVSKGDFTINYKYWLNIIRKSREMANSLINVTGLLSNSLFFFHATKNLYLAIHPSIKTLNIFINYFVVCYVWKHIFKCC